MRSISISYVAGLSALIMAICSVTGCGDTSSQLVESDSWDTGYDTREGGGVNDSSIESKPQDLSPREVFDRDDTPDYGDNLAGNDILPGQAGAPCKSSSDCNSQWCIQTTSGLRCTLACVDECPFSWECVPFNSGGPDVTYLCIEPLLTLCRPCLANVDCVPNAGAVVQDRCIHYGPDGDFCASACTSSADCPNGYECAEGEDVTGKSSTWCKVASGTCACTSLFADQGAKTVCYSENEWGTCTGERKCTASGLEVCSAKVPAAENCNLADDDCDGLVDEETSGLPCSITNSNGTCPGTTECTGGVSKCVGKEATPEQCDGVDNNCNGTTDEGYPDSDGDGLADCIENDKDNDLIPDYLDNCPAVPNPDQKDYDLDTLGDACDPDDDNDKTADNLDCAPLDADVHPGATEVCDGKDNNCNFMVDEGFPDTDTDSWKDCVDLDDDNDGVGDDADCKPLDPTVHPKAVEICDGKDNDCDGEVDEKFPDLDGDGAADCVDQDIDGDGKGNQQDNCPLVANPDQADLDKDGLGDLCDPDADGDSIPDQVDNCPGLKNTNQADLDGDGLGDLCDPDMDGDGKPNGGDNCPAVPNPDQADADKDGIGDACEGDKDGDGTPDEKDCEPLDPAVHPGAKEICDGVDNNCNGLSDEGFVDTDSDGLKDCVDSDDDNDQEPDGSDCAPLDPTINSKAVEKCDGLDNDCNGKVDDGLGTLTCGKGVCANTIDVCKGGKLQVCDPMLGVSIEVCDGKDNDCDGLTDEDLGMISCGYGECAHTVQACVGGKPNLCDPLQGAIPEVCDGKDNDCDGKTDEDIGQITCGLGVCLHTVQACIGGVAQQCNPLQGAQDESCDGKDNDCDGDVDEGLGTVPCGVGECYHLMDYCVAGKVSVCNPFKGVSVEVCDTKDNDCNGLTDEALGTLTCGLGECFKSVPACKNGQTQSCDPLAEASTEVCDGKDNDCDGQIDEGLGIIICGKGVCQHSVNKCEDGKLQECDPFEGAGIEICDGLDNNCDGQTDEGFPDTDGDGLADCIDPDLDGDGIKDFQDNCPLNHNPNQEDLDLDGLGDACDPDADGDGVAKTAGDCDDMNKNVHPGKQEIPCNSLDDDCNPATEDGADKPMGQSQCVPGSSCKQILTVVPNSPDGLYYVDIDGVGGGDPFKVWCDMTTAGGGWTLVYSYAWTKANKSQLHTNKSELINNLVSPEGPAFGNNYRLPLKYWNALSPGKEWLYRAKDKTSGPAGVPAAFWIRATDMKLDPAQDYRAVHTGQTATEASHTCLQKHVLVVHSQGPLSGGCGDAGIWDAPTNCASGPPWPTICCWCITIGTSDGKVTPSGCGTSYVSGHLFWNDSNSTQRCDSNKSAAAESQFSSTGVFVR